MYKFTQAINEAIEKCIVSGSGKVELEDDNKTVIYAEWNPLECDDSYDVVEVIIYQDGIHQLSFQIEETMTESE